MTDLSIELKQLSEALEANKNNVGLVQGAPIQATDRMDETSPLLTDETKVALLKKSITLTHIDDTGTYTCIYLCYRVKVDNVTNGLKALAVDLNKLSALGLIHSTLATPGSADLICGYGEEPTLVVFCYVLVPNDKMDLAKELVGHAMAEDGSVPDPMEDISTKLGEGEFLALARFYHPMFMVMGNKDPESKLDDEIRLYLNVLPKGTEVVSTKQLAITGLTLDTEIRFRNPLMKNYKEVRLNHRRECVIIEEGRIEQFDLLDNVEYIKKDGVV